MRTITSLILVSLFILSSCDSDNNERLYETNEGINTVIKELEEEFGENAAYTSLNFSFNEETGTLIQAEGTNNFDDNKMMGRMRSNESWTDQSEITVEIQGEAKIRDFLLSTDQMNLVKLPEMVEDAKRRVMEDKKIDEAVVNSVLLNTPNKMTDISGMRYFITVTPVNEETDFTVEYNFKGEFQKMDY